MQTFTDSKGREWSIEINGETVKRVQTITGHNLCDLKFGDGKLLQSMFMDMLVSNDIAYALVHPMAEKRGVSRESFLSAMNGDAISAARDVILDATESFIPGQAMRAQYRQSIATVRSIMSQLESVELKSGDSSGDSQESSASTPPD